MKFNQQFRVYKKGKQQFYGDIMGYLADHIDICVYENGVYRHSCVLNDLMGT